MPYRLMTPQGFDSLKSYPVIVSLHGAGGTGTDNVKQLRKWNQFLAEERNRKKYPCYVLAPQTTELWNASDLAKIKEIIAGLPSVDMDRIYNCQQQAHFYYPYFLWSDNQREILWNNFGLETGD